MYPQTGRLTISQLRNVTMEKIMAVLIIYLLLQLSYVLENGVTYVAIEVATGGFVWDLQVARTGGGGGSGLPPSAVMTLSQEMVRAIHSGSPMQYVTNYS